MRKTIDRIGPWYWKPWEYQIMHSGYGMVWGRAWTRKGGIKQAEQQWGRLVSSG